MPANDEDELISELARGIRDDIPNALRPHVFNYMPARLLDVHDSNQVEVIDRSEVFNRILNLWPEEKIKTWIRERTTGSESGSTYPHRAQLSKIIVEEISRYAILSHRWLSIGEITFSKIRGRMTFGDLEAQCTNSNEIAGLDKLRQFCATAQKFGCSLAWADTCCIDKTSSSELDEAIRSMFRWYRFAHVCIVYLGGTTLLDELSRKKVEEEWVTRGWTLQELLAPPRLKFFSQSWVALCEGENDKVNKKVTQLIEKITKIPEDQLGDFQPGPFDIPRRMTWAANRFTTRIEDRAYSLIGIFGVSLIIAYGEGESAFGRLVEEIYRKRPHYEVFLWENEPSSEHSSKALPASPASYLSYDDDDAAFKEAHPEKNEWAGKKGSFGDMNFSLTNRGLRIKCLDVWVTLRCNPEVSGQDKWMLTLRPWHPLSRDIEDVKVLVDKQTCDKFTDKPGRYSKAIGVLDYLRNESDDPGYVEKNGRLVEGRDHFGWLLMCPTGYAEGWNKVMTYNTVRLRFKKRGRAGSTRRSLERPLIQVHL